MALSDQYVVDTLLQWTADARPELIWRESEEDGFSTDYNGVHVQLGFIYSRSGARRVIQFSHREAITSILEPYNPSFFSRRWKDQEQRALAESMARLFQAVSRQCADRQKRLAEQAEHVREGVLRQLVFGDS